MRIDYTIQFDKGWRIGSGEAAGRHLDSLIRRDGYGLPFIPGSTVRGVARDAACTLARALAIDCCDGTLTRREGEPPGALCGVTRPGLCPLCALTGSPHREPRVTWGPARLLLGEAGAPVWEARSRQKLGEQAARAPGLLSRPRPRTAIDARSGRAADEHLFTLEEAREDLELAGSVEIAADLPARDVSLLVAALRFVREIGGNRRRGLGACRVRIDAADLRPAFASWQEAVEALAAGPPAAAPGGETPSPPVPVPVAPGPRREIPALLTLDAAVTGEVVLGGRPESGNLIAGLTHVAGSTLRGALAARWQGDRKGEAFLRCFVSGRVRFGFLVPVSGQAAARPVPLSLHTCKLRPGPPSEFGHGFVDLLLDPEAERCRVTGCGGRLIPWGPRFQGPGGFVFVDDRLALSPHNRIDPQSQTVRQGALFAYEALPEGTALRGFIAAESPEDMSLLLDGLGLGPDDRFALRVGRRKGALGHLDCRLSAYPGRPGGAGLYPDGDRLPETWPESGLRIDLVTPALVLDEHLRFRESLTPGDLGLARGSFDASFSAAQTIAGWNSAHRLPKADQLAVAAGSSFFLARPAADPDAELQALARAARDGIGLRRSEGFGVITVLPGDAR